MVVESIIGAAIVGLTLGLLGSGGSILTVPILVILIGHEPKSAIAESLAIVGAIAAFGAVQRAVRGQVEWRSVMSFGPASMVGGAGGAYVSVYVPGAAQVVLLAGLMLLASLIMLGVVSLAPSSGGDADRSRPVALIALAGLGVGTMTGLVGIGGGFLIVPALVGLGAAKMQRAIGSSLAIITLNCTVAFATSLLATGERSEVRVDWPIVALFIGVGIAGAAAGRALGSRFDEATLKRVFACFVGVLAVWLLVNQAAA